MANAVFDPGGAGTHQPGQRLAEQKTAQRQRVRQHPAERGGAGWRGDMVGRRPTGWKLLGPTRRQN